MISNEHFMVEAIVERNGLERLDEILNILTQTGAIDYSQRRAQEEAAKAKAALQNDHFQQLKYHTVVDVRSSRGKNAKGHKITGLAVHGDKLLVRENGF